MRKLKQITLVAMTIGASTTSACYLTKGGKVIVDKISGDFIGGRLFCYDSNLDLNTEFYGRKTDCYHLNGGDWQLIYGVRKVPRCARKILLKRERLC